MYYMYLLRSKKDGCLYIGSTNDLRRRISEHNAGGSQSTMSRRPFELYYYEAYKNEDDARQRESALKKDGRALAQLKKRLSKNLQ